MALVTVAAVTVALLSTAATTPFATVRGARTVRSIAVANASVTVSGEIATTRVPAAASSVRKYLTFSATVG